MADHLAADDNGVYYNVSDGKKGMKSAKPGAQQGEQTQDKDMWNKCVEAIMATGVYKEGPIGQKKLEQKMRDHVVYVRRTCGPNKGK